MDFDMSLSSGFLYKCLWPGCVSQINIIKLKNKNKYFSFSLSTPCSTKFCILCLSCPKDTQKINGKCILWLKSIWNMSHLGLYLLWWNTMTKGTDREQGLYGFYFQITLPQDKESQDKNSNRTGTLKQVLMQRRWKTISYWLLLSQFALSTFLEKLGLPTKGHNHSQLVDHP